MDPRIRSLNVRMDRMERRVRIQPWMGFVIGIVLTALLSSAARSSEAPNAEPLRVRGLIVEDADGRARVVVGAPAKIGTDATTQDVFGIIINDAGGANRIVLSAPSPAPQMSGKVIERRQTSHGITIYDGAGNERGGFGVLDDGTVCIMTDHMHRDGAGAVVWRNGGAEVRAAGERGLPSVSVGVRADGFVGLYVVDGEGRMLGELQLVEDGKMKLSLKDADGNTVFAAP